MKNAMLSMLLAVALIGSARAWGADSAIPHNEPLETGRQYADSECLMCHSARVKSAKTGRMIEAARAERMKKTVHKKIHCVQCHSGAQLDKTRTHMTSITLVECGDCHFKGNKIGAPQKDIAKEYYKGVHGQSLIKSHGKSAAPHCWDCHSGHNVKKPNGKPSSTDRDRIVKTCTRCHYDAKKMRKYNMKSSFIVGYDKTPHATARRVKKNTKSAICTDCHGNHYIHKREDPRNPLGHDNLPDTCGRCHEKELAVYRESIHGTEWLKGNRDVPVCSTCHGEHEIRYIKSKDATVYPTNVVSVCSDCHANEKLTWKYKIKGDTVSTYRETYHGIVVEFGDAKVANCSSCHGYHDILPPDDPRSSVNPKNLPETCSACHGPAEFNRDIGRIHTGAEPKSSKLLFMVKLVYVLMIAGSVGGMMFFAATDLFGWFVRRRRAGGDHGDDHHADPRLPEDMLVERWPVGYRAQHFALVFSFTTLVLTGIPLVMPASPLFKWIAEVEWAYNLRGHTHRAAGFLMIAMCVYHVIYLVANRGARRDILNMIPKPKDASDALNTVLYNLTLKNDHPAMPRYNFIEKFEYLAMAWGSFVMVATGLVLTFNSALLQYLPKWAFDVATLVHKFEAILATLAIIIWHMYTVHLCPDFFPMNRVFLNGKISLRNLRKHHGAEYEEIKEKLLKDLEGKKPE